LGSTVVITVNVNPLPLPQTIDGNICVNLATNEVSPYTLETHLSDNLYDFAWTYNGQSVFGVNSTLIASLAGIYSVVATNVNTNCRSLPTPAVVTESNPGMSFTTTQTLAFSNNATITVDSVTGGVNVVYQYSLDFGPFQLDNFFENVTPGPHTITVADDNGCTNLTKTIYVIGYPTYFTPNGDGINDTWNIIGLNASAKIFIFDRNGKLIKQISPTSEGWDGTLNGQQLSATDFWFTVDYTEDLPTVGTSKTFKSHFSLKR
jgi:gliding motility-associated-like protein